MDILERVLEERAGEFARTLTEQAGFTPAEADRFLVVASPVLIESYEWQARGRLHSEVVSEQTVRDVLAGIPGRWLATALGLSPAKTWAGLRALVPAALEATARAGGRHGRGGAGRGGAPRGGRHGRLHPDDVRRFEIGLG